MVLSVVEDAPIRVLRICARPQIRDLLIMTGRLPQRQILAMIISNLTIEWTGPIQEIFVWDQATGLAVGVSQKFASHIYDLDNWGINVKLLDLHPELDGMARFVDLGQELEDVARFATTEESRGAPE